MKEVIGESSEAPARGRRRAPTIVQSASRVVRILERLLHASSGRTLAELSAELSLHRATMLRLLRTLVAEGIVRREPASNTYHLTPKLWLSLAMTFPEIRSIRDSVRQLLDELASASGATAIVGIPAEGSRTMVLSMYVMPKRALRVQPSPYAPMHVSAGGKCYLASLGEDELREWLLHPLPKMTRHTITSATRLGREVRKVRKQGYAVQREEMGDDCGGLAVPVRDDQGNFLCAVHLATLASEMTEANVRRWTQLLHDTASKISALIGESWPRLVPRRNGSKS